MRTTLHVKTFASLFSLAPDGVYLAIDFHQCGALLPHLFTLTFYIIGGGIFSVALSVDSRPPGVTWHPVLWSPDFPPPHKNDSDHPVDLPSCILLFI